MNKYQHSAQRAVKGKRVYMDLGDLKMLLNRRQVGELIREMPFPAVSNGKIKCMDSGCTLIIGEKYPTKRK